MKKLRNINKATLKIRQTLLLSILDKMNTNVAKAK